MISVENFYWVLYSTLLKPVDLDCWYYYPWGTTCNLSKFEMKSYDYKKDTAHALFHYDQEPIWTDSLGPRYDLGHGSEWSSKYCKILANSEYSDQKNSICRQRYMLDWYYFYHGFAALDWFSDAKYIDNNHDIQDAFLSFNHITTGPRLYRLALLLKLLDRGITDHGSISFHTSLNDIHKEIIDKKIKQSDDFVSKIKQHLSRLCSLPWQLDNVSISGDLSARFGHQEYNLWQRSLLHVVNETVFYESKLHLTEKIFKPIVATRPFILVAAPGNLEYLRSYGFKTFGSWIDESYDNIQDPNARLEAVAEQIDKIAQLSPNNLKLLYRDMLPVLIYNKKHFFGEFKKIIVNELVDNFDQCIRIWNNGRVDGRELPLHPDLDRVKRILLS
jgi:hypothetical protein